jgi:uncharacterized protein (TIGR04141 family)
MSQIPNIYRIDKEYRLLNSLSSTESIIERILTTSFKNLGYKKIFNEQHLKSITKGKFTYFLYLFNSDEIVSDWQEFLPAGLNEDENFTLQKLSLILFIETENDIFCVIGGNAYQIILPFIDHSFGLNTYSRIMKPEFDELTSIKSRGITGARAGLSEQFRDNYKIIDFIKFGKVPQEIHLKLSEEISDLHFKFLKKNANVNEKIQVSVGKAFKLKKGIDFNDLHKIVEELVIISELAPSDYLSSYEEITNKEDIETIFKPELVKRIYDDTANLGKDKFDIHKRFEHDFCNPNNIEKFYEADEYKLKEKTEKDGYAVFKTVNDRAEIYDAVLSRATEKFGNNFYDFRSYIQGVRIACYKDEIYTKGSSFLFHISAEFNINGKPIFLVDTKWYHLRDSFLKDLKINTVHVLKTYKAPSTVLNLNWNKEIIRTEKEYNLQYNLRPNYIVVDTIISDGLELCDILHYDDDNLYLIHVKYGFSSKMRELTNQITISARRLKESLGTSDKIFLDKLYNQLIAKQHNINNLSLDEFKNLFNKKISYVLGFTSHLNENLRVENNIDKFESNIARFSLIQCSGEMRANYYDMLIYQIERE